MRVLTVRNPWGPAIIYLGKPVENRSRNIAGTYRGPVAIHTAGPKPSDLDYINEALRSPYFDTTVLREKYAGAPQDLWWGAIGNPLGVPLVAGAVIGVVDLVDVHHADWCWDADHWDETQESRWCSPWAMPDQQHLVLANPRPLTRPIPAKGHLGLWRPDADLEAAINDRLAAGR